ncbi:MAG TPA: DUF3333 domain-containing protein, partial [Sphingomonadaceae bacterium]|nr:DUF3333 domain-containing protein [Sphingomonadaceae bacterium]
MSEQLLPAQTPAFQARLRKRYKAERRFRLLGLSAILFSVAVLLLLLFNMGLNGIGGFQRAELAVTIDFPQAGLAADRTVMAQSN